MSPSTQIVRTQHDPLTCGLQFTTGHPVCPACGSDAAGPVKAALPALRDRAAVLRFIVRRLRRRFHALPVSQRPALDPGTLYGASLAEVALLGRFGSWPLPPRAVEAIRRSPTAHRRRPCVRLRHLERVANELDTALTALLTARERASA